MTTKEMRHEKNHLPHLGRHAALNSCQPFELEEGPAFRDTSPKYQTGSLFGVAYLKGPTHSPTERGDTGWMMDVTNFAAVTQKGPKKKTCNQAIPDTDLHLSEKVKLNAADLPLPLFLLSRQSWDLAILWSQ